MEYHILNGMCLYDKFPPQIEGEKIVMNEALLHGPLGANLFLEEFWKIRADFWKVSMNDYEKKTVVPLEKLTKAKKEDTILFWFGIDLFCQINIWFLLDFIGFYHFGLYADPLLLEWFQAEYPKHATSKLDMGKSCVRFKQQIPYELVGELIQKMSPSYWIDLYEKTIKR